MSIVSNNIPYNSTILYKNLNMLLKKFAFINVKTVGYSLLKKPLYAIKLGCGPKEVFYSASFHANEWITSIILMKFIEDYCSAYIQNSNLYGYPVRDIFNSTSIYIMPMVNPDGVDLSTGSLNSNSVIYKKALSIANQYISITFPDGWKSNLNGVDLNLQFPAGWKNAKKIKNSQGVSRTKP